MFIKELPESERPYEKLQIYGAEKLSNAELLAIIIKTGSKEESAINLACKILSLNGCKNENNLKEILNYSIEEFMSIKGIGKVKATQLVAVGELAKRLSNPINILNIKITSPKDVYNLFINEFQFEKKEIVKLIILNIKNNILKIINLAIGGTNFVYIHPKDILHEAIKVNAPKIILVHNHPSGDPTPSEQDIVFTNKINECSKLFGIQLVDHIVIGSLGYESIFSRKKGLWKSE